MNVVKWEPGGSICQSSIFTGKVELWSADLFDLSKCTICLIICDNRMCNCVYCHMERKGKHMGSWLHVDAFCPAKCEVNGFEP